MDAMQMMTQAKEMMNALIDTLYDVACSNGLGLQRDTLVTEFEAMSMYVAGTDNDISSGEITLMNYMFDLAMTPENVPELIRLLSETYDSLINEMQLTGWMISKALDDANGNRQFTDVYIECVDAIMHLFAAIDGSSDSKEEAFINSFVNRLRMDR